MPIHWSRRALLPTRQRSIWLVTQHRLRRNGWARAMTVLALMLGTFQFISTIQIHRQMLLEKYSPTIYTYFTPEHNRELSSMRWRLEDQSAPAERETPKYSRRHLLANRAQWERLGSGFEGEVFAYRDVVVKIFKPENAPFRDCVPSRGLELRWPTEITASIMLGGMADGNSTLSNGSYLPVVDYFLSPSAGNGRSKWHLLTPFLAAGNLKQLSRHLRRSDTIHTARDLDVIFRPSFDRLLDALDTMHTEYNLCHDDVRPDNIFLRSPDVDTGEYTRPETTTHWMLADLGNVREPSHPYHSSMLWFGLNSNLPDCRANDVFRLVKSYVMFLRSSVKDVAAFDVQFLDGAQPWSRMFWATRKDADLRQPVSAARTKQLSTTKHRAGSSDVHDAVRRSSGSLESGTAVSRVVADRDHVVAAGVLNALKISAAESVARRWGLVPLLGVPVGDCRGGIA